MRDVLTLVLEDIALFGHPIPHNWKVQCPHCGTLNDKDTTSIYECFFCGKPFADDSVSGGPVASVVDEMEMRRTPAIKVVRVIDGLDNPCAPLDVEDEQ
jgi:hypothetical protein